MIGSFDKRMTVVKLGLGTIGVSNDLHMDGRVLVFTELKEKLPLGIPWERSNETGVEVAVVVTSLESALILKQVVDEMVNRFEGSLIS